MRKASAGGAHFDIDPDDDEEESAEDEESPEEEEAWCSQEEPVLNECTVLY